MQPLFIGYAENEDDDYRLYLTDDDLETHVHGIGASRTGKSKMIEWLARELIRRQQGFCLIDPHGHLYHDLVKWMSYLKPKREIVLFNPSSTQRIVGFNPFQPHEGDVSTQADRRVKATIKAWGATDADQTPRLERWLRSLYHALLEQGYSLEAARYLLNFKEKKIRDYLTKQIRSDLIRNEFEELSLLGRRDFFEQIESTRNRLFRFLAPRQVRRIMALDTNNLKLDEIINQGKILLVNLQPSDVLSDENARLIGTLLLNELWEVGMRRKQTEAGKNPSSFYVIIDEFQKFLTPDIPAMLDQAAKYGIHLCLFHQHLSQLKALDEQTYGAVMTNARTKIVFGGLSREDAYTMAQEIFPKQIDLKRIKFLIEQTKFWPVVGRAKVFTKGSSGGSGSSSTRGSDSGMSWVPGSDEWTHSSGTSSSESSSDSSGWSEGESDVPFIYPEAFKEVSSITPYSLEEMLWQLSDQLIEQYQRHFMIRRPGKPTVAGVTPYVKTFDVSATHVASYTEECLKGFKSGDEVDHAIEDIHRRLALTTGTALDDFKPDDVWEKPLDTEPVE